MMSQANAKEAPTPAAGPWMTATTGCGQVTIDSDGSVGGVEHIAGVPLAPGLAWSSSLIPAPERNRCPLRPIGPPDRRIAAALSSASAIVSSMGAVREFRLSGRFSVTDSTPSSSRR